MKKQKTNKTSKTDMMALYRCMLLTREFEAMLLRLFKQKGLPEVLHLCKGEEAIGVGAGYAMQKGDIIVPSLRSRSVFLTRGVPPSELMAGVMGKKDGPSKGKFTAHHLGDLSKGIFSTSLCIGSQMPLAVGAGLHFKYNQMDRVALTTFGDGATNRGDFHESLNMAAIFKIPVIFICENNQYAIDTPATFSVPIENIALRAKSYGITGVTIDGNDVLKVYHTVRQAMDKARAGDGPTLIECRTYRMRPHTEYLAEDRSQEELTHWGNQCPIKRFQKYLLDNKVLTADQDESLAAEIKQEVQQAVDFAEKSPFPDLNEIYEDVYTDVYSD